MASRGPSRATRILARLLSSIFYREVQVEGAERIPGEGPLIYAVNHPNSLVDPLLIHGMLPRNPRFLAKSTLWDMASVRPFLILAGSIPVYRAQDKEAKTAQNVETLDACFRALADGAAIGIFPEGLSHTEPSLMPIKTGIARIVLGAEKKYGPLGIRIVPVGLNFEEGHLFRSRVLITVGEPLAPLEEVPADKGDFRRVRNALTKRVEEALRKVTLNYGSRREARLLARAGDLYARAPSVLPDRPELSGQFEMRRQFAEGYEVMRERLPERVAEVAMKVDAYDRMLRITGFTDEQIVSSYPAGPVMAYLVKTSGRLIFFLPLAAVGILLNWLPYRITARIAKPHEKTPQNPATYKILGGLFTYPVLWFLQAGLAALLLGGPLAAGVLLLSPLTGYLAMRFLEDSEGLLTESRNYLRLRTGRQTWRELGGRRRNLSEAIGALAEAYLESRGDPTSPAKPS